ncbi:MAG: hypothetical protein GTO17_11815 [Candidatus Aminicenantes bacterium]|nr:hypothetical protein [Candidatus Aminicenantes bacterium]
MKTKGKKFVSLFLVLSLLALSANLYAKEKRGAKLIITKTDRQQVKGELIAVKENSLLLLDSESGADVSIDIADIRRILIVKKSKKWKYGLLVGGGVGLIAGIIVPEEEHGFFATFIESIIWFGLPLVGIVAIIEGRDKVIQIKGRSDTEVKEVLEKLSKKSRIPDYQ